MRPPVVTDPIQIAVPIGYFDVDYGHIAAGLH
jgi:hypothetical protein